MPTKSIDTRHTFLLLVLWQCIATVVIAEPGVVRLNLDRVPMSSTHEKRDLPSVSLFNASPHRLAYCVNASIGTPSQMVSLILDTGSSDTWMYGARSAPLRRAPGFFEPDQSSTYCEISRKPFDGRYGDGTHVTGTYMQDTLAFGDSIVLPNLTMALVDKIEQGYTAGMGILGIAFDAGEAAVQNGSQPYPNFMDLMVEQKLVSSKSYSLDLRGNDDRADSILFGGYDTSGMEGNLSYLALQPLAIGTAFFTVNWTSLTLTDKDGSRAIGATGENNLTAVLDSGTSLTLLPTTLFAQLSKYFDAHSCVGMACFVSCDIAQWEGSLEYEFAGITDRPKITVPFSELAIPVPPELRADSMIPSGGDVCMFGLSSLEIDNLTIFGDTFLRSAYVFHDLDNKQVGIAQAASGGSAKPPNVVAVTYNPTTAHLTTTMVTTTPTVSGRPVAPQDNTPTTAVTTPASTAAS